MDCDKYLELMSAALDGELSAEERRELDSHLAVCPDCAQLYQNLSGQSAVLRELDCEVPADLKQRIMSSLPKQEQPAKQGKVIRWKRWAPVAAAACLALVVALVPKGGMMANTASAPEACAPTADAPRSPAAPEAPGAAPMPSAEMESYIVTNSEDSTASVSEAPSYGVLEMDGLTDPAEPSGQEPQPDDGGMTLETAPAEPPMSAEPADDPAFLDPANPQVPTDPEDERVSADRCSFENPLSIRVSYGATPEPGAVIIGSVESLEQYLDQFGSNAFNSQGNPIPNEKLETLKRVYNEEFFRTRRLLCVVVESGSGSNRYEITDVFRDGVRVSMYAPEIGTADMAAWLLTAEVDDTFHDGDTPEVSITNPDRQTTVPIGTVKQELTISLAFENQRGIRISSHYRPDLPEPGAQIIGSAAEMNAYLAQLTRYDGDGNPVSESKLDDLRNRYAVDDWFYETNRLLCILIYTRNGGDQFRIAQQGLQSDNVVVEQTMFGATYGREHFLIVTEVGPEFDAGDQLETTINWIDRTNLRKIYDVHCWYAGSFGQSDDAATVIHSVEELHTYLDQYTYWADPAAEDVAAAYTDEFFETHTLVAITNAEAVTHLKQIPVLVNDSRVYLYRDDAPYGNTFGSVWLTLIEIGELMETDKPLELVTAYHPLQEIMTSSYYPNLTD